MRNLLNNIIKKKLVEVLKWVMGHGNQAVVSLTGQQTSYSSLAG
jgi:hypothetical protein